MKGPLTIDNLIAAGETLGTVAERLAALPEDREHAVVAALVCQYARFVVIELASHLSKGVEPYEALRRTAVGELPLRPEHATLLKILKPIERGSASTD